VPALEEGEPEPFRIRPAAQPDLPFLRSVYDAAIQRYLVACVRDLTLWRYELRGMSEKNVNRSELRVIEAGDGQPVGFLSHPPRLWRRTQALTQYELQKGTSWLAAAPSVLRYLQATGDAYATRDGKECAAFAFSLGAEHPAYRVMANRLPKENKPYAWYLRVPDLGGFLQLVKPALEARLAASALPGHTGELRLSFYRHGLRLAFQDGQLHSVEPWMPMERAGANAGFPGLTFLQLLFGYRSLAELRTAFADCWCDGDEAQALLEALFPKRVSDVWPVN
jgi:hypothetical protein